MAMAMVMVMMTMTTRRKCGCHDAADLLSSLSLSLLSKAAPDLDA
jgi:hypothetical protein